MSIFTRKTITCQATLKNGAQITFKCVRFNLTADRVTVTHSGNKLPRWEILPSPDEILTIVRIK